MGSLVLELVGFRKRLLGWCSGRRLEQKGTQRVAYMSRGCWLKLLWPIKQQPAGLDDSGGTAPT